MKKLFSTLSSTLQGGVRGGLLFLALMATTCLWAYDFQSGGLYYNITSSSAPYTVEVIGAERSITSAVIPSTVTSVNMPNSVTSIGNGAFADCYFLTSVTIPNSVTSMGSAAFYDYSSPTSVTIPNSVTSIGEGAFFDCDALTSITIPNSVTIIKNLAFKGCSSLTSMTIGNSVTSIGDSIFSKCVSLTEVICRAVEVPQLGADVFYFIPLSEATLYVPAQSLDDYKAANQWKEFGTILPLEDTPSSVENIPSTMTNCQKKTIRNGQLIIIRDGVEYNTLGQAL